MRHHKVTEVESIEWEDKEFWPESWGICACVAGGKKKKQTIRERIIRYKTS